MCPRDAHREPVMVEIRRQRRTFPLSEHSGDEPEALCPLPHIKAADTFGKLGGTAEFSVPEWD